MRRSTLAAFNVEEDSNPAPSNARAARGIFDSLTASYSQLGHRIQSLAQGTGRVDPSNMAELTVQPRGDMATGILLELDTLGETLEQSFFIILHYSHYSLRNN